MERRRTDILVAGAGAAGLLAARAMVAQGLRVTVLEARPRSGWCFPWWVEVDSTALLEHVLPFPGPSVPCRLPEHGADFVSPSRRHAVHLEPSPLYGVALDPYLKQVGAELQAQGVEFYFDSPLESFEPDGAAGIKATVVQSGDSVEYKARMLVLATGTMPQGHARSLQEMGFYLPEERPLEVIARHETWKLDEALAAQATWPSTPGTSVNILSVQAAFSTLGITLSRDLGECWLLSGISPEEGAPSPSEVLESTRSEFPAGLFLELTEQAQAPIPLSRPMPLLASRGVALLGNLARQVSPLTASGLALAGRAARMLASVAVRYCRTQEPGLLFQYSSEYVTTLGATQAFAEGLTRTVLKHGKGGRLAEAMFEAGYIDAAEMIRVLGFRPLDLDIKDLPRRLWSLLKRPELVSLIPGAGRALAAYAATQGTYPHRPDAARIEAFDRRLSSILAN